MESKNIEKHDYSILLVSSLEQYNTLQISYNQISTSLTYIKKQKKKKKNPIQWTHTQKHFRIITRNKLNERPQRVQECECAYNKDHKTCIINKSNKRR